MKKSLPTPTGIPQIDHIMYGLYKQDDKWSRNLIDKIQEVCMTNMPEEMYIHIDVEPAIKAAWDKTPELVALGLNFNAQKKKGKMPTIKDIPKILDPNELQVAIYCKQIADTKWYQFRKRSKLYKKACDFAKSNNVNFPIKTTKQK